MEAKLQPLEEGREYAFVRLTLSPTMPKGPFHSKLVLHTDSAQGAGRPSST